MKLEKGQKISFEEMYEWLSHNEDKKWRLYAVGGTFGYLSELRWNDEWITQHFEKTNGGHKIFRFASFDENCHFIQEIAFGGYEDLDYRIEIFNIEPLEILIEYKDRYEMDSQFAIFQELV